MSQAKVRQLPSDLHDPQGGSGLRSPHWHSGAGPEVSDVSGKRHVLQFGRPLSGCFEARKVDLKVISCLLYPLWLKGRGGVSLTAFEARRACS